MNEEPKHLRHKPPTELSSPRELVLACPPFRSGVNLARIIRLAGCSGVQEVVACGSNRIDPKIARDAIETVKIKRPRTLNNWLRKKKADDFRLVALEQSNRSINLHHYQFKRKSILLIGHERDGIPDADLKLADDIIEIPVYGRPFSYNVATATTMAVYEYCRQYPNG